MKPQVNQYFKKLWMSQASLKVYSVLVAREATSIITGAETFDPSIFSLVAIAYQASSSRLVKECSVSMKNIMARFMNIRICVVQ